MSSDYYQTESEARPRGSLLPRFFFPVLFFIAGAAGMGWLLSRWTAAASLIGVAPPPPQVVAVRPAAAVPAPAAITGETQRLVIDPETSRRVMRLEQRMSELNAQARTAVGNADRAEGLLVAFAARRALDRGVGLGYLEGLLRQRFGASQAQAVGTIITASRQPVTLEALQEGLQQVGPELTGGGPNQNWLTALKAEFNGLVTIRKSGTPSTMPDERLKRATRRLEAGQVDVALAEVLRMPGRDNAGEWLAQARRYVAARHALDTVETAALLDPRALRRPPSAVQPPAPAPTPAGVAAPAAAQ
ncbi:MAG: hypothetical protein JWN69_1694 [Alphaproteobacteria bacterium]|nr:hypothetical protein [Alphaproteobacteria bacterium]